MATKKRKKGVQRRWAWRLLPFEYRFGLACAHRKPKGDKDRIEVAKWLRACRNAERQGKPLYRT